LVSGSEHPNARRKRATLKTILTGPPKTKLASNPPRILSNCIRDSPFCSYIQRGPSAMTLQVAPELHVRVRPLSQQSCPMSPQSFQVPVPLEPVDVQPRSS